MGLSLRTAMMIASNPVVFFDTAVRSECWICHEPNEPHALVLSCPLDKRLEMEQIVADIKARAAAGTLMMPKPEAADGA